MRYSVITLLFIGTGLSAQPRHDSTSRVPFSVVKVSPYHLLNFYPTVELSYEQRIFPHITVQAEGGYVLDYGSNQDIKFQNKRGVKLKLEGRYYFDVTAERATIFYSALEPYTNIIDFDRYGVVQECFDGACSHPYNREFDIEVNYRERGASVKIGALWFTGLGFLMDLSVGCTLRDIVYDQPPLPPGAVINDEPGFFRIRPDEQDRQDLSPAVGIRIGYRLR